MTTNPGIAQKFYDKGKSSNDKTDVLRNFPKASPEQRKT